MRIQVIENLAGFEGLRGEWNELLDDSDSNCLFLTWEWLYTWWKHLSGGRRLFIVTVRQGRELLAIAPLALRPPRWGRLVPYRSLEFLGTGAIGSDYLDSILRRREQRALQALAEYLANQDFVLELAQLSRESSFATQLAEHLRQRGWKLWKAKSDLCPFINLSGHTWASYLERLGPTDRFQTRFKNLGRRFDMRFEQARSEEECRKFLEILIQLHQLRWQGKGSPGAFYTPSLLSFHEELSQIALGRGWLRLFVLWLDGRPAASLYGFMYERTFYFYQSGFDPQYAKHSVGFVTMGLTVKSAIEEGAEEYDLLHGDEPYKFHWTDTARELDRVEFYPPSLRGSFYERVAKWGRLPRQTARRLLGDTLADRIVEGGIVGFWKGS